MSHPHYESPTVEDIDEMERRNGHRDYVQCLIAWCRALMDERDAALRVAADGSAVVDRIELSIRDGDAPEDVADALALVFARRVLAMQPSIGKGVGHASCDMDIDGAPMRVNVFRKTPEMIAARQRTP